jgi:uronate dehydrogenase
MLSLWLSPEDMVRLVQSSLDADNVHFEIVYGVSANQRGWYESPGAAKIGYVPRDNAKGYLAAVRAQPDAEDEVGRLFQGGQSLAAVLSHAFVSVRETLIYSTSL